MAAVPALALREAIIPLATTFSTDDLNMVKVEHHWTEGADARDRSAKMYLPTCDDPSKKELFLYVIDQFLDAMSNDRLHLSTGPNRYSKFRVVVNGSIRLAWQTISANRANKTTDTFDEDLRTLINQYLAPTARADQLEYLRTVIKPYGMSTEELSGRIRVLSRLGRLLPGSYDEAPSTYDPLYESERDYKRALFGMMPMAWRIKFAETGHELDDAAYQYSQLTRYMSLQEAIEKSSGRKRPRQNIPSGGRGRGRGPGGRGYGRGRGRDHGGRGYGRGRGRGYGDYSSYGGNYPPPNNRFLQAAAGGRYGQGRGMSSPRAGYQSPRGGGRPVTASPRRPIAQGQGRPPVFPQFTTDEHYYEHDPGYGYGDEHYYGDYDYGYEYDGGGDMYYQGDQYYPHMNYPPAEHFQQPNDQYYGEGEEAAAQGDGNNQEGDEPTEEAHFLQDFGY